MANLHGVTIDRVDLRVTDMDRSGEYWSRLSGTEARPGALAHGVSEALYLRDPDGLGIELYWDRPREVWPTEMFTAPLDLEPILAAAEDDGAPVDLGHVHLQASNIDESTTFWRSHVGLDLKAAIPQASFLSADD